MVIVSVGTPFSISAATLTAVLIGMAKFWVPPWLVGNRRRAEPAVFMPMTSLALLYSGPPESPGCSGAFIWISPVRSSESPPGPSEAVIDWSRSVTVPLLTEGAPPTPPALPTAVTASPICTLDESPTFAISRPDASSSCSTATSAVGSVPTTCALYVSPVVTMVTVTLVAPSITWLFVSTSPEAVSTMPVPAAALPW